MGRDTGYGGGRHGRHPEAWEGTPVAAPADMGGTGYGGGRYGKAPPASGEEVGGAFTTGGR
jgi:hypothetical protein